MCAPVVGGAFARSNATWRWGFYLNLVVGGIFASVYLFLLPSFDPRFGQQDLMDRFQEIDYTGALLRIGRMVSIFRAINFRGTLYAWKSGQIIALFAIVGVLVTTFAFQQQLCFLTTGSRRMFPVQFQGLKRPAYALCSTQRQTPPGTFHFFGT